MRGRELNKDEEIKKELKEEENKERKKRKRKPHTNFLNAGT